MYVSLSRHRFLILLGALVLLLFASPLIARLGRDEQSAGARLGMVGLFLLVLLSAVYAVSTRRRSLLTAFSLGGATVVLQALSLWNPTRTVLLLEHSVAIAFVAHTVILLLGHLFTAQRVTVDTIAASLCTYLLLGLLWAFAFSLMELSTPGAFRSPATGAAKHLRYGGGDSATALYFSFVTLSTLGYGDITPVSMQARMLAVAEAVMGQVYLAVLVARLVGLHIVHGTERWTGPSA